MLGVVAPVGAGVSVGAHYANNNDSAMKIKSWELFANKEIFKSTYAYVEVGDWKTSLTSNPFGTGLATKASAYAIGVIYVF